VIASAGAPLVGEVLGPQLGERLRRLPELEIHTGENPVGLRELDLVVLHDLDDVPTRIAEVEAAARQDVHSGLLERVPRRLLVVHDQPEMRLLRPGTSFEQGEELVAELEERRPRLAAVGRKRSV